MPCQADGGMLYYVSRVVFEQGSSDAVMKMRNFFLNVCHFFASPFHFSQLIILSDIISAVAMIAAVVAAIVAIHGNKQSQEATRKTKEQFQKNMQEQNRSINFLRGQNTLKKTL